MPILYAKSRQSQRTHKRQPPEVPRLDGVSLARLTLDLLIRCAQKSGRCALAHVLIDHRPNPSRGVHYVSTCQLCGFPTMEARAILPR